MDILSFMNVKRHSADTAPMGRKSRRNRKEKVIKPSRISVLEVTNEMIIFQQPAEDHVRLQKDLAEAQAVVRAENAIVGKRLLYSDFPHLLMNPIMSKYD